VIWSSLQSGALQAVEGLINGALNYDSASREKLGAIEHQVLLVDCALPPLQVAIEVNGGHICLHQNWQGEAAITVSGSLVALTNLAISSRESSAFTDSGVKVSGNLQTLHQLNHILANLDIDWEAALADLLGDIPAHIIGETVRKSAGYRAESQQRIRSALAEVAQEEFKLTPSPTDLQQFTTEVRQLAADTDRLVARAQKLFERIEQKTTGNSP